MLGACRLVVRRILRGIAERSAGKGHFFPQITQIHTDYLKENLRKSV